MAQPGNRMLDEFAKLLTDAAGVAQGARREAETVMRAQAERFMGQMDLVQRDEFEAVREMASKARLENDALRAEIEALKAQMNQSPTAAKKTAGRAAAAKKSVKKPAA